MQPNLRSTLRGKPLRNEESQRIACWGCGVPSCQLAPIAWISF